MSQDHTDFWPKTGQLRRWQASERVFHIIEARENHMHTIQYADGKTHVYSDFMLAYDSIVVSDVESP